MQTKCQGNTPSILFFGVNQLLHQDWRPYVVAPDGSNLTLLPTPPSGLVQVFSWSPDGTKIAGVRNLGIGSEFAEIYVMNADGSNLRQLTNNTFPDSSPVWSPDGRKIAFIRWLNYQTSVDDIKEVYVMDADGSNQTPFTQNGGINIDPKWLPDGRLSYRAELRDGTTCPGQRDLFIGATNITKLKQLGCPSSLSGIGGVEQYSVSPTGQLIFACFNCSNDREFSIYSTTGGAMTKLGTGYNPVVSPDGTKIAFDLTTGISGVMHATGEVLSTFSLNTQMGRNFFSWSPDSTRLAFPVDGRISVINADGTNLTPILNKNFSAYIPFWRPN